MTPDVSSLEFLSILSAFVFGGFCKGFSGLGVPVIAVPVIASTTDLTFAIIMIAIPSVVPNFYQVWRYRKSWNHQFPLHSLSIFSVIGSGVGIFVLLNAELKKRDSAGCATQEILDSNLADYKRAQETEKEGDLGDGGGSY